MPQAHPPASAARPTPCMRLREATRTLHTEVERSSLMQQLFRGRLERAAYAAMLRNLLALYLPMEAALARQAQHPQIAALPWQPLQRSAALQRDLLQLHGADWAAALPLQPAAVAYAQHLRHIGEQQPGLLAAHAYVRYLGDLSGGQQLTRWVARGLGLAPGEAVAFYDFGDAQAVQQLAQALRDGLDLAFADALPAPARPDEAHGAAVPRLSSADALVDEACQAFRRHGELFAQLAQPHPGPHTVAAGRTSG